MRIGDLEAGVSGYFNSRVSVALDVLRDELNAVAVDEGVVGVGAGAGVGVHFLGAED